MAVAGDKAEEQLREITECPICMSTFTDPIMLPCIHTFCFDCLKRTRETAERNPGDTMPCPLCRKEFIIPPEGIIGLQRNFFMENLLEYKTTLKSNHPTLRIETETKEQVKPMSNVKCCNQHDKKPVEYYCIDCKIALCAVCIVESHKSHDCKDVATVEESFRQTIRRAAWKASNYADEMLSVRKISEMIKTDFLKKLEEMEATITKRNHDLKAVIDKHTNSLLDDLAAVKSINFKEIETQLEEIDRCCTSLRSFESYCTEITRNGSANDICSSVDKLISRADELEKDHMAFMGGTRKSIEISFQTTNVGIDLKNKNENLVGRIDARPVTKTQSENFAVGVTSAKEVIKVNLQRPNDVSSVEQIPSKTSSNAVTAVYCNTMYVTGVGDNLDEIWKYNNASGWMKCASMVQRRDSHIAVFVDEILYICGGHTCSDSHKRVLNTVEAYNAITNKCTTVGKLMRFAVSYGNCVPYKSSLYIFGSSNDSEFQHVQVYNTKENKCSVLSTPTPRPCCGMRAVLWDTSAILIGRDSCFIFNFETKTWQERKRFKTDLPYHFSLVLENENVFVIGGTDMRCVPLKKILCDEPNEWEIHATLPTPTDVFNCVEMRLLV